MSTNIDTIREKKVSYIYNIKGDISISLQIFRHLKRI